MRIRLLHFPCPHIYGEGFVRESETVSGSKLFGRNAVHLHRRRHLSRVAGAVDPVFADADGLPGRNGRSRHGAARIGHHGLHVPCRPPDRKSGYAIASFGGAAADGVGDVRHDRLESERIAMDDRGDRIHPGSRTWISVRSAHDRHLCHACACAESRRYRSIQPLP